MRVPFHSYMCGYFFLKAPTGLVLSFLSFKFFAEDSASIAFAVNDTFAMDDAYILNDLLPSNKAFQRRI